MKYKDNLSFCELRPESKNVSSEVVINLLGEQFDVTDVVDFYQIKKLMNAELSGLKWENQNLSGNEFASFERNGKTF